MLYNVWKMLFWNVTHGIHALVTFVTPCQNSLFTTEPGMANQSVIHNSFEIGSINTWLNSIQVKSIWDGNMLNI